MKNNIKLFACDLDGTLFNENHNTDEIILKGILEVKNNGDLIVPCTGRSMHFDQVQKYGFEGLYRICMNGALVYDNKNNPILKQSINKDFLLDFANKTKNINVDYFGLGKNYSIISFDEKMKFVKEIFCKGKEEQIKNMEHLYSNSYIFFDNPKDVVSKDIFKIDIKFKNDEEVKIVNELIEKYQDCIVNKPSSKISYELTDVHVDKSKSIKVLVNHLNIDDENIYVFGDGKNDVSMLETFKNSYCPSDGTNEAKEAASNIIGPHFEHSVINKIMDISKNS